MADELVAARRAATLVIAASISYLGYGLMIFAGELRVSANYSTIEGITLAAVAFTELGVAVAGVATGHSKGHPALVALKVTGLSSALVSISLAQTALLSFSDVEPLDLASAGGCVFMAVLSLIAGMWSYRAFTRQLKATRQSSIDGCVTRDNIRKGTYHESRRRRR